VSAEASQKPLTGNAVSRIALIVLAVLLVLFIAGAIWGEGWVAVLRLILKLLTVFT
jgi:cell division protein FtsB